MPNTTRLNILAKSSMVKPDTRFEDHQLIATDDGSYSVYLPQLKETYHSVHGAVHESTYVYIMHGLDDYINQTELEHETEILEINVLEVGFGTGLNASLAADWAMQHNVTINYTTLEPYPIPEQIITLLNYNQGAYFDLIHAAEWANWQPINPHFKVRKIEETVESWQPTGTYDIIFYDAFGPRKQPEVWSANNIMKCAKLLTSNGLFTTYCAQGQFRRSLRNSGLSVISLEGPPYKNEMTQGWKRN